MDQETEVTRNSIGGAQPPAAATVRRGRRRGVARNGGDNAFFALGKQADDTGNGLPELSAACKDANEAIARAFQQGIPYYRIQKFTSILQPTKDGGIQIVGVPAE